MRVDFHRNGHISFKQNGLQFNFQGYDLETHVKVDKNDDIDIFSSFADDRMV